MTNDEIRKLLGGYATNSLTETERKDLFEAALEDQELFNALHQEQALKELLADQVSRAQIRQALEKPPSAPWLSRWWVWTGAVSAVAATVLIVAVTRTPAPVPRQQQQIASVEALKPVPEQPAERRESDAKAVPPPAGARMARNALDSARRQTFRARPSVPENARKDELQTTTLPAAPPAPPAPSASPPPALTSSQQVQVQAQAPPLTAAPSQGRAGDTQAQSQQVVGGAISSLRDQEQTSAVQSKGGMAGAFFTSNSPPVRYTLLKRDQDGTYQPLSPGAGLRPGDAVRLSVAPVTSGYLSLSRQDAAGQWTRVYPETGPGLPVSMNANYTIPASPIGVTNAYQTLRLTLVPTSVTGVTSTGQIKARTAPLKKERAPNPALFVDLTIGPKSVP
jgi:hypothetical protein